MKKTRTWASILLAALLLTVMVAPAAMGATVYSPVKLTNPEYTFKERLYITQGDTVPNSTYTFSIDNSQVGVYTADGITYGSSSTVNMVSGKPSITTSVSFNNSSTKAVAEGGDYDGNTYVEATVTIDFGQTEFTEPGIYFWKITKSKTVGPDELTNNRETLFAVVRVIDDNGTLKIDNYGLVHSDRAATPQPNVSGKVQEVFDEYPSNVHNLTLSKTVAGSLGSKDEYFKYEVVIEGATILSGESLTVVTTNGPGTTGATLHYGETANYNNPATITLDSTGKGNATFWLKHSESIVIQKIPDGSKYTITESELNGYVPTVDVSGDTDRQPDTSVAGTSYTVTDNSLKSNATVAFTNTKESSTPTGINLQVAGPIFGLLLVGLLLMVVMTGKRKEN